MGVVVNKFDLSLVVRVDVPCPVKYNLLLAVPHLRHKAQTESLHFTSRTSQQDIFCYEAFPFPLFKSLVTEASVVVGVQPIQPLEYRVFD